MSYYSNGKTYTDHPLMDEICYNCKLILKGIVIKNDVLANNKETQNSLTYAEMYYIQQEDGYISFELYPFDYDVLYAYYGDAQKAAEYEKYKDRIPEEDRESLTDFANEYFKENFVEENDYYRMLMGLPPFDGIQDDGSNTYDIPVLEEDLPSGYTGEYYEDEPLHKQPTELIEALYASGKIDEFRVTYPGSNYSYMLYLGDKAIDLYTARKAGKWDILYLPNVYYLVEDRFRELYNINKEMYKNKSYQEFYADSGEYYDQMMILCVLCETFANLVTDVPEWYIRRDIFDIRSCKYFLDSYGVSFFKVIPLKYQIRIVKNINKLIKYKSSNQNNVDIIDIFDVDAEIYKYWLYKNYDKDTDTYNLEFVSSPVDKSYDQYLKDSTHRTPYDDITLQDKYWDGEDTHAYTKSQILNQEFTVRGTKYMSIEYHVSLSNFQYQMSYMLGTILDSSNDLSDIKIPVPSINETTNFKLTNLFIFLITLTNAYYRNSEDDASTEVRYKDVSTGSLPTVDEDYYDWKKKYFPEIFQVKNGRILGFNTKLSKEALHITLIKRNSHTRFGMGNTEDSKNLIGTEYLNMIEEEIEKTGFNKFIVGSAGTDNKKFSTISELMDYYNTNTAAYEMLEECRTAAQTEDESKILDYVFQEMYTRDFDKDFYKLSDGTYATDLVDILKDRDYILYNQYVSIANEANTESRQDVIRNIMNDIIDTLEYYFYDQGVDDLFAFTTIGSFSSIIYYIYLMINFFKSYKVYFLDPYTTYDIDYKLENSARAQDVLQEKRFEYSKWDKLLAKDQLTGTHIEHHIKDYTNEITRDIVDIYSHNEDDPLSDYDYDGEDAAEGEAEDYFELDGGEGAERADQYLMVNGGFAHLGMLDWEDINGANAYENPCREYFEIDGGVAFDENDFKTDAMGSQMFNYDIDGGASGGRYFINNSMKLYLVGTEIFGEAVISPRNDARIEVVSGENGGLYLSSDDFVDQEDFNDFLISIGMLRNEIVTIAARAAQDIKVLKDMDLLTDRIKSVVNSITYNMEYAIQQMTGDTFVINNKQVVDLMIARMKALDTNPYEWVDLDD